MAAEKYCRYKVTTQAGVNIRSGPSTNHTIVGTYAYNQKFWAKATPVNRWRQISAARYVTADHTAQVTSTPCQYSWQTSAGADGRKLSVRQRAYGPVTVDSPRRPGRSSFIAPVS